MAEARGEMDEGVRKLEDFIAAMNAVRERLNDQADFDAVDEAVSETAELARQIDAEGWWHRLITIVAEKEEASTRVVVALAALHQSAAEQRLPPVEEQLEDGRRQLEATFDEAREKLEDQADDIHQGLDDLRETLQDLGHDLDQAMSGLESAFGDLEDVVEETTSLAEASFEFIIAMGERMLAHDNDQQLGTLRLLEGLRELKGELMEMLADEELAAKVAEAQKCANTWSGVFTLVATVVVVVVAIIVMLAAFGAVGVAVVAVIAVILMSRQVLAAVTAAATDFAQALEAGETVAADLGVHLPQLPGVSEVVGKVNDLLSALNPFD